MRTIAVTAHRGCKGYIPENTLPSFAEALRLGVDVLEYDVHMTLDGELVIMHDSLVERTTGAKGAIDFMTLDEVRALDAGEKLYGAQYRGTPVPTLRETLALFAAADYGPEQIVEIKDFRAVVADKIVAMLDEFGLRERTIIECGDAQVLVYLHKRYPDIRLLAFPAPLMKRLDPDIYDYAHGVAFPLKSPKLGGDENMRALMAEYRAKGAALYLFSGDNAEEIERCLSFDADNITSNYPGVCLDCLREKGLHS